MWVQTEIAPPCMQIKNEAGVSSEVFFIAEKFLECLADSLEKQVGHQAAVHQPEFVQLVRDCKDQVPMSGIKQFPFLGVEPAFDLNFVALGAVAVSTGVVPDIFYMPIRAGLYVATHSGSPATYEVVGGFVVMGWQFFVFGIVFEGLPEYLLNGCVHCQLSVNQKPSKIDYFPSVSFPQRSWARTTPQSAAAEGGRLD